MNYLGDRKKSRPNDGAMDRLVKKRKSDRSEELQQEYENLKSKRSRRASTESSEHDNDSGIGCSDVNAVEVKVESKGWSLMQKSGYKPGSGLGALGQGRIKPVEAFAQPGRFGLGHEATKALAPSEAFDYDANAEIKSVEETPISLAATTEVIEHIRVEIDEDKWIIIQKPNYIIENEDRYCDAELIQELIKCKNVFDSVPPHILNRARARANPYETIKAGFFQNRAAMKTANIDRVFNWALSGETDEHNRHMKNPVDMGGDKLNDTDRERPLFYFADVCAGPGGFSEYMLWRKAFYNAKGFGFTLRGNDDFKLDKFMAASPEYFETYYGCKDNGDVTDPENLSSLEEYVKLRTHGENVHLVMCDGGFSVKGQENIQEILSKRLYLCQFIVGLSLAKVAKNGNSGGNFLCKLFDIFTPFSMGLVYLMYCSFERIYLHKPISSRPANSERYIFCESLTEFGATVIKNYLVKINNCLDMIKKKSLHETQDVYEIVPEKIMRDDELFFNYVLEHNESTIKRQIFYLKKYRAFAQNQGACDFDQTRLRETCLAYWDLPAIARNPRAKKPATVTLKNLTTGNLHWEYGKNSLFSLEILKPRTLRHKHWAEYLAALLPESSEPMILVSNGGKDVSLKRDLFENFQNMPLPSDTVLFVQVTDKYMMNGSKISKCGNVIYVLDAAFLSGDDISNLPFPKRLKAIEKFCDAVNKSSAEQNDGNCELVCATYMELDDLVATELDVRKFKLADVAIYNITGQSSVFSTCRAVRFVNIMKPHCSVHWSNRLNGTYICDETVKDSSKNTFMKLDAPASVYASFYECVRNSNLSTNGHVQNKQQESFPGRSWYWNWDTRHEKNFSVTNVLNDESHEAGITLKSLRARLQSLEETLRSAPTGN